MEQIVVQKKALTKLKAFPGAPAAAGEMPGGDPWQATRGHLMARLSTANDPTAESGCGGSKSDMSEPPAPLIVTPVYAFDGTQEALTPGVRLRLAHTGAFECGSCGKSVKKLFDGFCYPCLRGKACADNCVMAPHLCHYQAGTCREPVWGETFCYRPHFVYLSYTGKFKVGLTRENQVPVRWIDQGATQAVLFARVTSRHQAGVIEKLLMEVMADKSHWLRMLQSANGTPPEAEVLEAFRVMTNHVRSHADFVSGKLVVETPAHLSLERDLCLFPAPVVVTLRYPLEEKEVPGGKPEKITSVNFDKQSVIEGTLLGIKGQYLFLDGGRVFNVRRHEGYVTDVALESLRG